MVNFLSMLYHEAGAPSQITCVSISALFYLDESFYLELCFQESCGGVGGGLFTFFFSLFTCVPSRRNFLAVYLPLCESICDPRDIKAPVCADVPVAERLEAKGKGMKPAQIRRDLQHPSLLFNQPREVAPDQYADENGAEPISPLAPLCCLA